MDETRLDSPPGSPESTLRERILDGSYRVDPGAVADAIIARHGRGGNVPDLLSEMLVAQQAAGGRAAQVEPLAGHDAA